jgi:hypothetical protein
MRATSHHPEMLAQNETIFATANGFLGLRGDHEENHPVHAPGVFLNGFYESWPIVYGESAYGFAKNGQTIVNVTDAKIVKLYVDDEPFDSSFRRPRSRATSAPWTCAAAPSSGTSCGRRRRESACGCARRASSPSSTATSPCSSTR